MKFFQRPGFLAASALLVLLVLSWMDFPPLTAFSLFFTKTIIAPIYRAVQTFDPALEKENRELRAVLQDVASDRVASARQKANDEVRSEMMDWAKSRAFPDPIIATVLTAASEGERSYLLLDKGSRDGVQNHAVVITKKGVLVGRVEVVREATSFLRLLTDPEERFSVRKEDGDRPTGITQGQYEGKSPTLQFAPREEKIERDALLLTSGLDDGVPAGLLAGRVQEATVTDNDPWQNVTLAPLVHPSDLTIVGILIFAEQ